MVSRQGGLALGTQNHRVRESVEEISKGATRRAEAIAAWLRLFEEGAYVPCDFR
jgi:hypothetical protein